MAVETISDTNFNTVLSKNGKVIVEFYADWCGSCRLLAPKYKRLSEDERFTEVAFYKINSEENPEARRLVGVSSLPFFATFADGKQTNAVATSKEEAVVGLLEDLVG